MGNSYFESGNEQKMKNKAIAASVFMVIAIIIAAICTLSKLYFCGAVALIQAVLIFFGCRKTLFGEMDTEKENSTIAYFFAGALCIVFAIGFFLSDYHEEKNLPGRKGEEHVDLGWPAYDLFKGIERPESVNGYVEDHFCSADPSSDAYAYVSFCGITDEEADAYVTALWKTLFREGKGDPNAYHHNGELYGWLTDGREVSIYFNRPDFFEKQLEIHVIKQIPLPKLTDWPKYGVGAMLPDPREVFSGIAVNGRINTESSDYFACEIEIDAEDTIHAYAEACLEAGFTEDFYLSGDSFSGQNKDGNQVSVSRDGGTRISIYINK